MRTTNKILGFGECSFNEVFTNDKLDASKQISRVVSAFRAS